MRSSAARLVALLAFATAANVAIELDKLDACDDVARLYQWLREAEGKKPTGCRPPSGPLERALASKTGLNTSQLCFQRSAPAASLEGFSCLQPEVPSGASLICFREAPLPDVRRYKAVYGDKYAEPVSRYLGAAARCGATNGDSSIAVVTLFPQLLTFISKFEFGFISLLGKGRQTDSSVIHGYASTDPAIGGNAPAAIEFFSVFTGGRASVGKGLRKAAGDWVVYIDDSKETNRNANAEFRKRNAPLQVEMTSYTFERRVAETLSQGDKNRILERLQKVIATSLEDEAFTTWSESEIKARTGKSSAELVDQIVSNMSYGAMGGSVKPGRSILVLMNEKRPSCTAGGEGAVGAYVFYTQPVPDVKVDYGGIGLIIAGVGSCSRQRSATRTYIQGLIEGANDQLLNALERNQVR